MIYFFLNRKKIGKKQKNIMIFIYPAIEYYRLRFRLRLCPPSSYIQSEIGKNFL